MDPETENALDIAKEFFDFLFIAKMVIVYDAFPSVDLEYVDNHYKISVSYLDYKPVFFNTPQALLVFLKSLSLKRTISRIHITNGTTTAVVYGNLYSHELIYTDRYKIVRFKGENGDFEKMNNLLNYI
jgi:hypothetical protein